MSLDCGSNIISSCVGTTWNFITAPNGEAYTDTDIKYQFQKFVNKIVAIGTYFLSYIMA